LAIQTGQPLMGLLEAPPELVKALRAAYNEKVKEANRRARNARR